METELYRKPCPSSSGHSDTARGLYARHGAQMLRHLFPGRWWLIVWRDRIQCEKLIRQKSGGLMGQTIERGSEQARDEEHEKREGDLDCDQDVHQPSARAWISSAFESIGRVQVGRAECGHQSKQQSCEED